MFQYPSALLFELMLAHWKSSLVSCDNLGIASVFLDMVVLCRFYIVSFVVFVFSVVSSVLLRDLFSHHCLCARQ